MIQFTLRFIEIAGWTLLGDSCVSILDTPIPRSSTEALRAWRLDRCIWAIRSQCGFCHNLLVVALDQLLSHAGRRRQSSIRLKLADTQTGKQDFTRQHHSTAVGGCFPVVFTELEKSWASRVNEFFDGPDFQPTRKKFSKALPARPRKTQTFFNLKTAGLGQQGRSTLGVPRKALRGGISKVNFHQVCQLLATISHKMAPRTGQSGAGITPRRALCGSNSPPSRGCV